jgi:CheY-like chemotaxis protein
MPSKLLLADDSVTIQKVVGISFANEDVQLLTVDNGDDALARIREERPQVVLADVVMPGKNGYEVCEAIKSDPELRHIPVLLLTGTFETFDEQRAQRAGADGHITKPFEAQTLVDRVNALLASAPAAPEAQTTSEATPAAPDADSPYDFFDDELTDPGTPTARTDAAVETDDLDFESGEAEAFVFQEEDAEGLAASASHGLDAPGKTATLAELDEPLSASDQPTQALVVEAEIPTEAAIPMAQPIVDAGEQVDFAPAEAPGPSEEANAEASPPSAIPSADLDELFGTPAGQEASEAVDTADAFSFEAPQDPETESSTALLGLEPPDELELSDPSLEPPEAPTAPSLRDPAPLAMADPAPAPPEQFALGEATEETCQPPAAFSMEAAAPTAVVDPLEDSAFDVSSSDLGDPFTAVPEASAAPDVSEAPEPPPVVAVAPQEASEESLAADLPPALRQQLRETLEKIAWEAFGDLADSLVKQTVERVEAVAWEVIPQMAEALIREEIRKLKED